jgi:hypothetical protein
VTVRDGLKPIGLVEKVTDQQFPPQSTVAGMNLVEWLRTPRYLKSRLMMETRPLNRLEMEVVFLEVSGGKALLRFPVLFMLMPKGTRTPRTQPSQPEQGH